MKKVNLKKNQKIFAVFLLVLLSGVTIFFIGSFAGLWRIAPPVYTDPPTRPVITNIPSPDTDGQITLHWQVCERAERYSVFRYDASGSLDYWIGVGTATSYTETRPNGLWSYTVNAYNDAGESGHSAKKYVEVIITETPPPPPPVNEIPVAYIISVLPSSAEQGVDIVTFSGYGTDSDGTIIAYKWTSDIDGDLSTSKTFSKSADGLSVGTHTIRFKVKDNDGDWSLTSARVLYIEEGEPEPIPTELDAPTLDPIISPDIDGDIDLVWTIVSDAISYNIYFSEDETSFEEIVSGISGTTYTHSGLTDGTYYYKITAENIDEESGYSNIEEVIVEVTIEPTAPDAPVLDKPTENDYTIDENNVVTIQFNWDEPEGAVTYNMYQSFDGSTFETIESDLMVSNCEDIISGDGTYVYKVTAVDIDGLVSEYSNTVTIEIEGSNVEVPEDITGAIIVLAVVIIGSVAVIYIVRRLKKKGSLKRI